MVNRRGVLAGLLATAAWPVLAQGRIALSLAMPPCGPGQMAEPPRLSFAGADRVQLLLRESEVEPGTPRPVALGARVEWSPDPVSRFGGAGRLDGEAGNFSGRRHQSAEQLFRPWARVRGDSVLRLFDPGPLDRFGPTVADGPATWVVEVDGAPVQVTQVHRKTVPVGGAWISSRRFALARRHLLTLTLAAPVPPGARVRVSARGMAPVEAVRSDALVSELVHVCHAGYALAGPKKGYVGLWLGHDRGGAAAGSDAFLSAGQRWRLVATDSGAVAAEGPLALAKDAASPHEGDRNFNGCSIFEADFSALTAAGRYRLEVEGIGASPDFEVMADPTAELLRLVARWYYHQRSGIAIKAPFGEGRLRPRNGHPEDGLTVWQTPVQLGPTSEGYGGPESSETLSHQPSEGNPGAAANPAAWGGWHDAGDWDRRIQHLDAVYMLAHIVENYPTARALDANIPESGRPFAHPDVAARRTPEDRGDGRTVLPDLIHEALWGISLWRRTQTPEGGIIGGVEYSLDGINGSVSWNPVQRTYAYAPEPWAAYRFVTGAAKLGHVVGQVCGDAVLAAALKAEAEAAWRWAEAETGAAGDGDIGPEVQETRVLAAASLYRAVGLPEAAAIFERLNPFKPEAPDEAPPIPVAFLGHACFDYVLAGREGRAVKAPVAEAITGWLRGAAGYGKRLGADYGLHSTDLIGWGSGWYRFGPGSNWHSGLLALQLLAGAEAEPATDAVLEGLWFALGCNPSNVSFVQGLGKRDFADPLVVDFDGLCPVPGTISIGVAAGALRDWEVQNVAGALYPAEANWPPYARIWETRRVISCSEFAMRDNVMEWLHACALAHELLSRRCGGASGLACPPAPAPEPASAPQATPAPDGSAPAEGTGLAPRSSPIPHLRPRPAPQ